MPPKAKTEPTGTSGDPIQATGPDADFWARLTAPFADDEIELLPKPFDRNSDKGKCDKPDRDGHSCGGWHGLPAVHLSYVGHAGLTMRLNEVCGPDGWDWEPFVLDPRGLPAIADGGLWIRLKITTPSGREVVKIGYGDAPGKSNATKELIGDALRNAAMRFGIGTYLWGKSDKAKAHLARGDADARVGGDQWENATPANRVRQQQDSAAEAPQPTPHPAIQEITDGIGHLLEHQKAWLIDQWTAKGWPPLRTWTVEDTPTTAPAEARALLKAASERPDPEGSPEAEDEPPF